MYANLGGTGSGADASRPQAIRYGNVGSTSVESLGGSLIRFDLLVTNRSAYRARTASKNGINGRFAQINFAANTEVTLRVQVVPSCCSTQNCLACDDVVDADDRAACNALGCCCSIVDVLLGQLLLG